jgi:hypothetical protein
METYGQLQSEKVAEENLVCRKIVSEISRFEISDRQRLFLIYLLALELENAQSMQAVTAVVKDVESGIFIAKEDEPEEPSILQGE